MTRLVAALMAAGVSAAFAPVLRNQVRDGSVGLPLTGTLPIRVRRDEHPFLFWASVAAQAVLIAALLAVALTIGIGSLGA